MGLEEELKRERFGGVDGEVQRCFARSSKISSISGNSFCWPAGFFRMGAWLEAFLLLRSAPFFTTGLKAFPATGLKVFFLTTGVKACPTAALETFPTTGLETFSATGLEALSTTRLEAFSTTWLETLSTTELEASSTSGLASFIAARDEAAAAPLLGQPVEPLKPLARVRDPGL